MKPTELRLDSSAADALDWLREYGPASCFDYAYDMQLAESTANNRWKKLEKHGLIHREPQVRGANGIRGSTPRLARITVDGEAVWWLEVQDRGWSVYLIEATAHSGRKSLHVGCAKDPIKRFADHQAGRVKQTQGRKSLTLIGHRGGMTKSEAHKQESRLRKGNSKLKRAFVEGS